MNSRIKIIFTVALLLTAATLILGGYRVRAQRQAFAQAGTGSQDRTIVKKSDFDPPVKIVMLKTRKGEIETGKSCRDDSNWLKGLTVGLENGSGKSLRYVRIEVQFRRPEDEAQGPPAIWYLEYGDYSFQYKTEVEMPPLRVKSVLPGETLEISLSEREFNEMVLFLKKAGYSSGFNAIELRITNIGFTDGTVWSLGRMLRRDPKSPWGWIPVDAQEFEAMPHLILAEPRNSSISVAKL